MKERQFDNFKTAITDRAYFFGRDDVLQRFMSYPFRVYILLGGRRIGKSSVLSAVERRMLLHDSHSPRRAFPVFVSLNRYQPESLDHLRYLLIRRMRDAIERWENVRTSTVRNLYDAFRSRVAIGEVSLASLIKFKINNPDETRLMGQEDFEEALLQTISELNTKGFEGVCFLLDETEHIVSRAWANDAWSYFRSLKDSDTALKPFLGLVLAGYRDVKEYAQRVGSPLINIAELKWLTPLSATESQALVAQRARDEGATLTSDNLAWVLTHAGGHPYLLQQILNVVFDDPLTAPTNSHSRLLRKLLRFDEFNQIFSSWWNSEGKSDGFGESERMIYKLLVQQRESSDDALSQLAGLSWHQTKNALEILVGTGVIHQVDEEHYAIGAKLFKEWVARQEPQPAQ